MSTRKLLIVAPDRPDLLASLRRAIGHEPGIEIFYDRRAGANAPREQAGATPSGWSQRRGS